MKHNSYTNVVKFWQAKDLSTVERFDLALENYRILFAYHSGKIENDSISYHTTREIFCDGKVSSYSGDPRALFEQQNQKICYEYLKKPIVDKSPMTVELVLEIHRILTGGTYDEQRYIINGERPGEFKKHDYVIGKGEYGTTPDDVAREIQSLLDELNGYEGTNILKAAAYFHARFENIHPFADGNGRVGRTLLNYYLMTHQVPPLIVYSEDKQLYYECLEKYDREEDINPLTEFLKYETEKTWEKTLQKEKTLRKDIHDLLI